MLVRQATGHKIVSTSTAETVGRVDSFVIDPATRSVVALGVKKASSGDTLPWSELTAFGEDAVTVDDGARIGSASPEVAGLADKHHTLIGKRVLSTDGDELGSVSDIDIDPASGAVLALLLRDSEIEGERLVGVGSYAVVVRATLP